jgi:hypothetical protein
MRRSASEPVQNSSVLFAANGAPFAAGAHRSQSRRPEANSCSQSDSSFAVWLPRVSDLVAIARGACCRNSSKRCEMSHGPADNSEGAAVYATVLRSLPVIGRRAGGLKLQITNNLKLAE